MSINRHHSGWQAGSKPIRQGKMAAILQAAMKGPPMKIRCNSTLISALLLSLWLAMMIPGNLKSALTWKEHYFVFGHASVPNYVMPTAVANLGIVMIGLIVL
jgi:hypothetical protein